MKAQILVLLTLLGAVSAAAQSNSIGCYKMAGGGGTSSNLQYTANGTNSLSLTAPSGNLFFRLTQ